ncbi:hypothetical protein D3C71_1564610 [compost metagenome]
MKNLTSILSSLLILFPVSAFAHGEKVLIPLFFDVLTFLLLLLFIGLVKWKRSGKTLLLLVLFVVEAVCFYLISGIFYRGNEELIMWSGIVVPLISVLLIFFIFRNKFKEIRK